MLKSQSRFVTNHLFVVDEFSKAAHTHLVVTLWGMWRNTCTCTRKYTNIRMCVCWYVCACHSARVRMFVARQFLWGWKLYHLLHCTQYSHKKQRESEKATVGKTVKTCLPHVN